MDVGGYPTCGKWEKSGRILGDRETPSGQTRLDCARDPSHLPFWDVKGPGIAGAPVLFPFLNSNHRLGNTKEDFSPPNRLLLSVGREEVSCPY